MLRACVEVLWLRGRSCSFCMPVSQERGSQCSAWQRHWARDKRACMRSSTDRSAMPLPCCQISRAMQHWPCAWMCMMYIHLHTHRREEEAWSSGSPVYHMRGCSCVISTRRAAGSAGAARCALRRRNAHGWQLLRCGINSGWWCINTSYEYHLESKMQIPMQTRKLDARRKHA